VLDLLVHHLQAVHHRRADRDRGAMLVVVEHRDLHPLAQRALDDEALGRLDVFEVDGAEGGLERGDDFDQLLRVALVELDVEAVDAGELLEQHRLAFHHRLRRERADGAQAEHRGAVADHGDQVGARGVEHHGRRIAHDLLAGRGDAGRIGEREVALVGELLGRRHRNLAGRAAPVIFERVLLQLLVHRKIIIPRSR
jgi:hypothetical protein